VSSTNPLKIAILWHMHQPNYQEPGSNRLVMPWVRLHATKDYLDMPLAATHHEGVRTTFNLVPSLLDQLELYEAGGSDPHLELSQIAADQLTDSQKRAILSSFFDCNPDRMIEPFDQYRRLYHKAKTNLHDAVLPALFASAEMRDIQVWSNLAWVDPTFRNEEPVRALFAKGRGFTEEDKSNLLKWQLDLMGRIVPTYRRLLEEDRIDLSFTPYYHPILPLLCDTDSALEASPSMNLPGNRFRHPEDAEQQIGMSLDKYASLFGRKLKGMWPSEGSVSEEVVALAAKLGVEWMATDEEILFNSLKKSGISRSQRILHTVYEHGPGLKLFFRDHALSDRIGFIYSQWDADKAVSDFIKHLSNIRSLVSDQLERAVVPIILDGENAWEYFPDDGRDFLDLLYLNLSENPLFETVTMTEAASSIPATPLPSLFAGSWINHSFRIWIGHPEDNAAWDLLSTARNFLVHFQQEHPDFDQTQVEAAWRQIYIAEGSDWCWWYGDDHRGAHNAEFDQIFRRHLMAVYECLDSDIPAELFRPIHQGRATSGVSLPDGIITPELDGRVTHFYEWAGAGSYDCTKAGGSMHRVAHLVSRIMFGYDTDFVYIRLDFTDLAALRLIERLNYQVDMQVPEAVSAQFDLSDQSRPERRSPDQQYALGEILEIALSRDSLWPQGFGRLALAIRLLDGEKKIETWPEGDRLNIDVPQRNQELFWPT